MIGELCFTAEASCLNTGWRWCRSWISGQFTSVLFSLDQSLLLQLPLKPSRNLATLCNLLKGVVIQIHCMDKCQMQNPRYGCLFHGKEFRPLFWEPLFHSQCLNSDLATSYLHTHKLYLVPCSMPFHLVTLSPSKWHQKDWEKRTILCFHFSIIFLHWSREHIKPQSSCHVPYHKTSRHTWQMLVFFTTEKMKLQIFPTAFPKINVIFCYKVREKHHNSFHSGSSETHLRINHSF